MASSPAGTPDLPCDSHQLHIVMRMVMFLVMMTVNIKRVMMAVKIMRMAMQVVIMRISRMRLRKNMMMMDHHQKQLLASVS